MRCVPPQPNRLLPFRRECLCVGYRHTTESPLWLSTGSATLSDQNGLNRHKKGVAISFQLTKTIYYRGEFGQGELGDESG